MRIDVRIQGDSYDFFVATSPDFPNREARSDNSPEEAVGMLVTQVQSRLGIRIRKPTRARLDRAKRPRRLIEG